MAISYSLPGYIAALPTVNSKSELPDKHELVSSEQTDSEVEVTTVALGEEKENLQESQEDKTVKRVSRSSDSDVSDGRFAWNYPQSLVNVNHFNNSDNSVVNILTAYQNGALNLNTADGVLPTYHDHRSEFRNVFENDHDDVEEE